MIEEVLKERGSRYGEFAEHARITQELKETMVSGSSWDKCSDSQREALEMIAHKIGRIVNGDPDYDDSWIDIIGYSQLIVDEIQDEELDEKITTEFTDIWADLLREALNEDDEPECCNNTCYNPDDPMLTNQLDDLELIEINGIKVFISGSEYKKLTALKESNNTDKEPEDDKDQTYMNFEEADEIAYQEYLNAQAKR